MKISLLRENFYKGVAITSKAVSNKASIPSLSNILIKTEENEVKLTASDLFVTISVWVSAKIEEQGAITVPAKLLNSFLSQISEEKIDCVLDAENFNVKTGKVSSTFSTISAEQFPAIEGFDSEEVISIKSEDLLRAKQSLQFVPASTESRPVLTGILFNISGTILTLAVTDGFRMAEYKITLDKAVSKDYSFILPARSTIDIIKAFATESEIIEMSPISSKNAVSFKVPHMEAQIRLIEGEFPNYKAILPAEFATKVTVSKDEIFNAIKLASIFAKDYDNMVKLIIKDGKIVVKSQPTESGSNSIDVQANIEGSDIEIAFNAKYINDFLSNAAKENIVFQSNDPFKPAALKLESIDGYVYIVMPMKANW